MAITRDPDCPAASGELMAAFCRLSHGHDLGDVINAAANMLAHAIIVKAMADPNSEGVIDLAERMAAGVVDAVRDNWQRQPQPTDIPVGSRLS